jgi:hypothetical protein
MGYQPDAAVRSSSARAVCLGVPDTSLDQPEVLVEILFLIFSGAFDFVAVEPSFGPSN